MESGAQQSSHSAQRALPARYRAVAPIGEGAMGVVLRVHDRLAGQDVALKQVLLAPGLTPEQTEQELLTLAHEFRTLAGLRHPHIISVLDYGFDAQRRPFYTMELLQGDRSILEAGAGLPPAGRVALIIQALEALAYLHRRGVLHHDLKPANVLVADGRVRVLDFGLAVLASQQRESDAFGTLQYLAPEVLGGQPYTEAADLYSLGVIAYELLAGRHPFDAPSARRFIRQVRSEPPDLSELAGAPALAAAIGQLLSKAPAGRPPSAQAAIGLLRAAVDLPAASTGSAIRESYLQAATFVGREAELGRLGAAMEQARQGRGAMWLIGGESGVGKSRLLDELSTLALVQGFTVLRGQAVEGGGLPYQLWRAPLRHLAVSAELSDLEAGILRPLVPDIAGLLGRAIADVAELSGAAGQQRLILTVLEVLRRQREPLLLLLEDLQWASESLEPLRALQPWLQALPICVIGTYRSDERPGLRQELGGPAEELPLGRLPPEAIAALAGSMLGDAGADPLVQAFLLRETEGNVYFLVEVMRALAEAAGDLGTIGPQNLPTSVLAGGVQAVVRRRLRRVPEWGQPLLRLAAIAGREIDEQVLSRCAPRATLGEWLTACADSAVLEVAAGGWRFSHDKLRQALLSDLRDHERAEGHRAVAEAIEAVYGENPAYAELLANHWGAAHDPARALPHIVRAAELLIRVTADYARGEQLIERGLPYASDSQAARLLRWHGHAAGARGDLAEADRRYAAMLARVADNSAQRIVALNCLSSTAWQRADLAAARRFAQDALQLARATDNMAGIAFATYNLGVVAGLGGDLRAEYELLEQALAIYRLLNDRIEITRVLNGLSLDSCRLGAYDRSMQFAEESLQIARAQGHRLGAAFVLTNLANVEAMADLERARRHYAEAEQIFQQIGSRRGLAVLRGNQGAGLIAGGQPAEARAHLEEGLALFDEIGDELSAAEVRSDIGCCALLAGDPLAARGHLELAIATFERLGAQRFAADAQARLVLALLQLGERPQARRHLAAAISVGLGLSLEVTLTSIVQAIVAYELAGGEHAPAARWLGLLLSGQVPRLRVGAVHDRLAEQLAATLGQPRLAELMREGAALDLRAELRRQLDRVAGERPRPPDAAPTHGSNTRS